MPNTYTQLYIQIVFAVQCRIGVLPKKHKAKVEKYITGIVTNRKCKMLAVNCMPDHTHVFIGLNPDISIAYLTRDIKAASLTFINENKLVVGKSSWQKGYGAFSYSRSQLDPVAKYVLNQEEHHRKKNFKDEYLEFLQKFEIVYDENYLFEFYD